MKTTSERLDPDRDPRAAGNDRARGANRGAVASVRGSVVDVRFDEDLPPIYSLLRAGPQGEIVIEVLAQHDARYMRGIALTPTQGLARGMPVEDTGGPLKAPVGKGILSRMFDVFGHAIDRRPAARRQRAGRHQRAPADRARRSTDHGPRTGHRAAPALSAEEKR